MAYAEQYEAVAAGQSDQIMGSASAGAGDLLMGLLLVPASLSPGAVSIKDGSGSAITVFAGGADSLASLVPFYVPIYAKSAAGAWKVTTGSNISAVVGGTFG